MDLAYDDRGGGEPVVLSPDVAASAASGISIRCPGLS